MDTELQQIKKVQVEILRLAPKKNLNLKKGVHPWGVEPQSMEPESIILSIELRAQTILIL